MIIDPRTEDGLPVLSEYGMPRPARLGAVPGLRLAVRYITAATGRPPQAAGGVLAWWHLSPTALPRTAHPARRT